MDTRHGLEMKSCCQSPQEKSRQSLIADVPEVFLQEDFNLSNLETFNEVITSLKEEKLNKINRADNINEANLQFRAGPSRLPRKPPRCLSKDYLIKLQQELTDYLDVIEDKLSCKISNRSGDFFQVMSSVHSVLDELSLAIKSVTNLRGKCASLNQSLVKPNLRKINLTKTRNNEQLVLQKLEEISKLCRIQPQIQLLLSASDYFGALDLIAKSRVLLHKDFKNVRCLQHLESQLVELERMAGTMIQREFEFRIKDSNIESLATEFNNLAKLVDNFSNGFSDIAERNSLNLLSLLETQTEKFVDKFHGERKRRIELCLGIEQWKMVEDIPEDLQRLINLLVDERKTFKDFINFEEQETKKMLKSSTNHSRNSSDLGSNLPSINNIDNNNEIPQYKKTEQSRLSSPSMADLSPTGASKRVRSCVVAGGTTFVLTNSVIILLQTIIEYCKCCQDITPLSKDLMGCLQEILQLFNKKCFNSLFRTGSNSGPPAKNEINPRSITARSLVLAQRSLILMILVMPDLHDHFAELLPGDDRLRRFDEIKFSYEDHAAKIPGRIIKIVRDVIDAYLRDWEAKPPVPSTQFTEIVQYLVRLHDNIRDVLPPKELKMLFYQIHNTFEEVLLDHMRRLQIKSDASPRQMLIMQELALFKDSLKKITIFNNWNSNYESLWQQLEPRVETNRDTDKQS